MRELLFRTTAGVITLAAVIGFGGAVWRRPAVEFGLESIVTGAVVVVGVWVLGAYAAFGRKAVFPRLSALSWLIDAPGEAFSLLDSFEKRLRNQASSDDKEADASESAQDEGR